MPALVTLPPHRSVKLWVSVDARGAQPGNYTGRISITPLQSDTNKIELPLSIEVLNLRLPKEFPLTLCTWDYVPNRWFSTRTKRSARRHVATWGQYLFPVLTVPTARVDAKGILTIDWSTLDAELERLHGRRKDFVSFESSARRVRREEKPTRRSGPSNSNTSARCAIICGARGRGYEDYAFYLLDEPGLRLWSERRHRWSMPANCFAKPTPSCAPIPIPYTGLSWKDFERIEAARGCLGAEHAAGFRPALRRPGASNASCKREKPFWSYECVSAGQVPLAVALQPRQMPGGRNFFGLTGIGFWTHSNHGSGPLVRRQDRQTTNTRWVYPGELPWRALRWEAVRDGLEGCICHHSARTSNPAPSPSRDEARTDGARPRKNCESHCATSWNYRTKRLWRAAISCARGDRVLGPHVEPI